MHERVKNRSPADLGFGRKMNISKLRTFGCTGYVLLEEHKRKKSDKKSQKGIFVGYDIDSPSYRIYIEETDQIITSCNVIFDESTKVESSTNLDLQKNESESQEINVEKDTSESEEYESEFESADSETEADEGYDSQQNNRRILRNRNSLKPPDRYNNPVTDFSFSMIGDVESINVKEALNDKNWKAAMDEEFKSLTNMKTWKLVSKPKNVKPLTCRWVLRQKNNGRYRARLVIRGCEQKEGVDYFEVFSPVARHMSIRLILSIAASKKLNIVTFDVKSAFLHGHLDEEIYMYQPEGFDDKSGKVCLLKKSLYGLKQAPKNWNKKFSNFLEQLNFTTTDDDPCAYYNNDRSIILTLHVDDGLMVGKSINQMKEILSKLNEKFQITFDEINGKELSYLGMQIKLTNEGIFVSQSKYAEAILERFKFKDLNPVSTPIERGMVTDTNNFVNTKLEKSKPYREAIGSLLYLAIISRPDICFSVNFLSRFNDAPMIHHWKMIKRIFSYVKATLHYGIFFNGNNELKAYSDADYGGDSSDYHSTSGVIIFWGGPIVWLTKKQHVLANSTAEAEYRAAVLAIDEVSWICRIANELKVLDMNQPSKLCVDNKSAIHMLLNTHEGKITKGKKHVEISRRFIQQHINTTVKLDHVKSSDQLADILTKPMSRSVFANFREKLIIEEC